MDAGGDRGRRPHVGVQPHQAAQAPLQRAPGRRQELPVPRHHRGRSVAPGDGHAGCPQEGRALLRPLRSCVRHPRDPRPAAAHVPHPHVQRQQVQPARPAGSAVPALPHREVFGAVRRRDRRAVLRPARRRADRVSRGRHRSHRHTARGEDEIRRRRARVRAGRPHPRPAGCRASSHREATDGGRHQRRSRRHRCDRRRARGCGAGVLRPARPGGGPQGVHPRQGAAHHRHRTDRAHPRGALLRRAADGHAEAGARAAPPRRRRDVRAVADRAPGESGADPGAAARRQETPVGDGHAECDRGVPAPPTASRIRPQQPVQGAQRVAGVPRSPRGAVAHRVLRHEPHPGHRLRRVDGRRHRRSGRQARVPAVQGQDRRRRAHRRLRRLRGDGRGAHPSFHQLPRRPRQAARRARQVPVPAAAPGGRRR